MNEYQMHYKKEYYQKVNFDFQSHLEDGAWYTTGKIMPGSQQTTDMNLESRSYWQQE